MAPELDGAVLAEAVAAYRTAYHWVRERANESGKPSPDAVLAAHGVTFGSSRTGRAQYLAYDRAIRAQLYAERVLPDRFNPRRAPPLTRAQVRTVADLYRRGWDTDKIATRLGCTRRTVQKWVRKLAVQVDNAGVAGV